MTLRKTVREPAMSGMRRLWFLFTLFAAALSPAFADDELARNALNTESWSWGIWGKATVIAVDDPHIAGGKAKRVVISPAPAKPWDIGAYVITNKPIKKGDVIVLAFWARAEKLPDGNDFIDIYGAVDDKQQESTKVVPETHFLVGKTWKLFVASGTADKDYAPGVLGGGIVLGSGEQTIDFGPVYISDFGPGYDTSTLPHE